ncbi:maleylacetoacetate isomerase [Acinetobacter ursingii]|uniref:maleylacetoacetate isomerase n=1 Tax=Acinetobacter ursingii TaxID=108980 RepID=UPI00300A416A
MKLYSYFRSSAAFRVRIALQLKQLDVEILPVHLLKNEQQAATYIEINPSGLVPTLLDQGQVLTQSLSILEYLEEQYPQVNLLPKNVLQRAQVRAFAQHIASDIHPLNNLRVLRYLKKQLHVGEDAKNNWYRHWITQGFDSLEQQLQQHSTTGQFCFGDQVTFADCCLIPQVYNAKRFDIDLSAYPLIQSIDQHCMQIKAFQQAAPEQQPDWNI